MTENDKSTYGTLAGNRVVMDRFLERLRDSGNVRASCQAAGVPRRTAYNWRARWVTFAAEWEEALEDACDILEAEAWRRALKENSDRLLVVLLRAHSDKYKERKSIDITSGDEPIFIRLDR